MNNLVIYNARLVDSKIDAFGTVFISDGKIASIILAENDSDIVKNSIAAKKKEQSEISGETEFFDAKGLTLMPSFVDMHAHFRYPGQTQKEDLDSGLHAAVAGGFGTLVLMPNTSPVVSDKNLAKSIMAEADSKKLARIFQTVSITKNFEGSDTSALDTLSAIPRTDTMSFPPP